MAKNGNDLSLTRQQELALLASYGKQASRQTGIVGKLLRFTKGEYLAGQDDEEVPIGTKVIVNVDSCLCGWTLWLNKKPVDQDMGQIIKNFQPKPRSELSMSEPSDWPIDDRGNARDPWQFSNQCLMKNAKNGEIYTFTTTSKGGIGAVGTLLAAATEYMQEGNEDYPIVELNTDSYKHNEYGKILLPMFEIVDWSPISEFTLETTAKPKATKTTKQKTKGSGGRSLTYK